MTNDLIIREFMTKYDTFYKSGVRNTHVQVPMIIMYTRKSHRMIDKSLKPFLDIASITISSSEQKKGLFTSILDELLKAYPTDNFFIESIVNDNVRVVAERVGFKIKYQGSTPHEGYDMYLIR